LGSNSPLTGKNLFVAKPSEELSFFLGAWLGDGWADENDGGKRLLLKVRSYDFAKEFADCAAAILRKTDSYWVRRVIDKAGEWYLVKATSFQLYGFVNQSLEELRTTIEPFPKGFLRGFFTAEGNPSVSIEQTHGPYLGVGVVVANSDRELLEFSRGLLSKLGFHPGRLRLNIAEGERTNIGIARSPGWLLTLSRLGEARKFSKEIGFADSEKQAKLEDAISLVEDYGRLGAAREWPKSYEKRGKKWVRNAAPLTSSW
jgi:intein-encoded DNA endonuclease-like protein